MKKNILVVILSAVLALLAGCAAPVVITTPAKEPLENFGRLEIAPMQNQVVGEINQEIVDKIMTRSIKGIVALKRFSAIALSEEVALVGSDKDLAAIRQSVVKSDELGNAEADRIATLQITLLKYKKGNGFLRFLFGTLAGGGEVSMELAVANRVTRQEILKANTTAKIQGSFASEKDVIPPLSKAIVKFTKENF